MLLYFITMKGKSWEGGLPRLDREDRENFLFGSKLEAGARERR